MIPEKDRTWLFVCSLVLGLIALLWLSVFVVVRCS